MILCKAEHLDKYLGLSVHLDTAIRFLLENDLSLLPKGKTVIDSENVFVNRFDYDTESDPITEAHMRYIDVHIVIEGEETVGVADVSALKEIERREEEDYIGCSGRFQSLNVLGPGDVLIAFPEDAHSPKRVSGAGPCHVKKVVVKVLADG